jgi:tetratricopeptide (TPR) repeat protein
VANSLENLARVLRDQAAVETTGLGNNSSQSKLKEAEDLQRQALDMRLKILGPEDLRVARAYDNLGLILRGQGRLPEAEETFRKAFDMERKKVGDHHPSVAVSFEHLVGCLARQHKAADIETVANEILTPELEKTPQGARLLKARDAARAEAKKEN